eukprot:1148425-Pelagomonas_calceolata.AAC.2
MDVLCPGFLHTYAAKDKGCWDFWAQLQYLVARHASLCPPPGHRAKDYSVICSVYKEEKKLRKQREHSLYQLRKRRHVGSKSRESPSPEGKREASVGLGTSGRAKLVRILYKGYKGYKGKKGLSQDV